MDDININGRAIYTTKGAAREYGIDSVLTRMVTNYS